MDPADASAGSMFPTGQLVDDLEVPGVGTFSATMINAGIPTIFLNAADIGYTGTELQDDINTDAEALERFERAALEQDFRATTTEAEELARQEQALADARHAERRLFGALLARTASAAAASTASAPLVGIGALVTGALALARAAARDAAAPTHRPAPREPPATAPRRRNLAGGPDKRRRRGTCRPAP